MANPFYHDEQSRADFAAKIAAAADWSIDEIAELFADVFEDANAHSEALAVRSWVAVGCPENTLNLST